jgi:hypothetical protein
MSSLYDLVQRLSTSCCFSLCGGGVYSSLDTICVGIGVACGNSSEGFSSWISSSVRMIVSLYCKRHRAAAMSLCAMSLCAMCLCAMSLWMLLTYPFVSMLTRIELPSWACEALGAGTWLPAEGWNSQ